MDTEAQTTEEERVTRGRGSDHRQGKGDKGAYTIEEEGDKGAQTTDEGWGQGGSDHRQGKGDKGA